MSSKTQYYVTPNGQLVKDDFGWKEVKMIREMHARGATASFLAQRFHVSRKRIAGIVSGKTWREENATETE